VGSRLEGTDDEVHLALEKGTHKTMHTLSSMVTVSTRCSFRYNNRQDATNNKGGC
jgi:hypothetical protein